jgi:hypothetical protein
MIVKFDQTRENRPTTFNNRHVGESCRRGLRAILNRNDAAFIDVHDGIGFDLEPIIHRDYAPRERKLRAREWIDRSHRFGRRDQPAPRTGDSPG